MKTHPTNAVFLFNQQTIDSESNLKPMDEPLSEMPFPPEQLSSGSLTCKRQESTDQMLIALHIEELILNRLGSRVVNLMVVIDQDQIELHGSCQSFYTKQLAQEAIRNDLDDSILVNRIEVEVVCEN